MQQIQWECISEKREWKRIILRWSLVVTLLPEMQKAVNLINQFLLFFPNSVLILDQKYIFTLILGVLRKLLDNFTRQIVHSC